MEDLGRAKSALYVEAALRNQPVGRLPLRALGMGHEDDSQALYYSADVILQFECLSASAKEKVHPKIKELCSGEALDSLVGGFETGVMPTEGVVGRWRGDCQYAKSNEVSIEGWHATTGHHITKARNHSEAYVSCKDRSPEIQNVLRIPLE